MSECLKKKHGLVNQQKNPGEGLKHQFCPTSSFKREFFRPKIHVKSRPINSHKAGREIGFFDSSTKKDNTFGKTTEGWTPIRVRFQTTSKPILFQGIQKEFFVEYFFFLGGGL